MAYADRVKESSTSTGTGSLSLAGAASGFRTFAAGFTVGATMPYAISDALGNWEIGTGTLSASTTLARTTVLASSNGNALVSFPAGSKDVFCTLSAAQIAAFQVSQDITFATVIPLTVAGTQYMPQQTVASVLAFTVAASPVKGASVYVRLIADGTNAPTFTGMKEWGGSLGYDNRNGIANQVQFFNDGVDTFYSISQAVGAVAIDSTAPTFSSAQVANGSPTVIQITMSETLAAITPAASAFTVSGGKTVSSVSISGAVISLTCSAAYANGDTITATYTKPGSGNMLQDAAGNLTLPFGPSSVTNNISAVASTRLSQLTSVTESGTGPYSYTGTGGTFSSNTNVFGGVSTTKLQSGIDGSFQFTVGGFTGSAANEVMVGINPSGTASGYGALSQAFYTSSSGTKYTPFTGGSSGTPTNNVAPANGDLMRLTRTGSTLVGAVSKDSGSTWTTIFTWAGVSTGILYFQVMPSGACQANSLASSGLA